MTVARERAWPRRGFWAWNTSRSPIAKRVRAHRYARRLIAETGVGLAPGSAFGAGGEGHLRLCFACSAERLERAVEALRPAFALRRSA